jgi:hypothetical protein
VRISPPLCFHICKLRVPLWFCRSDVLGLAQVPVPGAVPGDEQGVPRQERDQALPVRNRGAQGNRK